MLLEPLRHIRSVPGFDVVIFRRTNPELERAGGLWPESYQLYAGPPFHAQANKTDKTWTFPPHGNTITFAHMQHAEDRYSWHGTEFPLICFDELTTFEEIQFFYMLSRNRSKCGVPPYIRATTNPEADTWVAEFLDWWINPDTGYVDPERCFDAVTRRPRLRWFSRDAAGTLRWADTPEAVQGVGHPLSVSFVPAGLKDNPALIRRDPGYIDRLRLLPFVERARLLGDPELGGNWKVRPASGGVFDRRWFRLVDAPPADVAYRLRYWDKAGTEGAGNWSVGVLMGQTAGGLFVVEDVVRGQWAAPERERMVLLTAEADGHEVTVYVEREPGSGGKESAEHTVAAVRAAGRWAEADAPRSSKVSRAGPLSAQAEAGNVLVRRAPWTKAFLDELHDFPQGLFADQVDAATGAYNMLVFGVRPVEDHRDIEAELRGETADLEDEFGGSFLR